MGYRELTDQEYRAHLLEQGLTEAEVEAVVSRVLKKR